MAYVVFGVMQNDQKRSIPGSLQKVPVSTFTNTLVVFCFPQHVENVQKINNQQLLFLLTNFKMDCCIMSPQVVNGKAVVTLRRDHITQTFPSIMQLVGSSIFVSVSVLTESGEKEVLKQTQVSLGCTLGVRFLFKCVSASTSQAVKWWRLK